MCPERSTPSYPRAWFLILCVVFGARSASAADLTYEWRCDPSQVEVTEVGDWHRVDVSGQTTAPSRAEGAPELPVVTATFALPDGMRIARATARVFATDVVSDGVRLRPVAAPDGERRADPEFYARPGFQPEEVVAWQVSGRCRGVSLGTVALRSLVYDARNEQLAIRSAIAVTLYLEADPEPQLRRHPARLTPDLPTRAWLERTVLNPGALAPKGRPSLAAAGTQVYGGFEPTELPSVDGPPVRMVIVTDDVALDGRPVGGMVAEFERLADWRTQAGVPAVVRTVRWIREHYAGHDDAAKVRAFLQDAYAAWGTDYVLLGGDLTVVPVRRFSGLNLGAGDPPADVYFGGLDNDWDLDNDGTYGDSLNDAEASDPYWDVWVGRAPVETEEEARVFVDKTLTYARAPGAPGGAVNPDYYDQLVLMAGLANCATWGLTCNGIFVAETILRRLKPPTMSAQRIYQELQDPNFGCPYHQTYLEVADSTQTLWTRDAALQALNAGAGFVHHFEHSNPYEEGGASGGFGCDASNGGALGREYIDALTNGPNYSIVYSTGAGVNAFDYDSVSEHWLLNPNGGAVGYIGKTRSGSVAHVTGEVDTLSFQNFFAGARLGQALAFSTQSLPDNAERAVSTFGLLGDPALRPFITAPGQLEVGVSPALLGVGAQELRVDVLDQATQTPIEGAAVVLTGDGVYVQRSTDVLGQAWFAFELNAPQDVTVAVTAPAYVPAATQVGVTAAGPRVVYAGSTVDDAGSTLANDRADAGEVLQLVIDCRNVGSSASVAGSALLLPIGDVRFDVDVDGGCQTDLIAVGRHSAEPDECTFGLDELEYAGVVPAGRPDTYVSSTDPGLFVHRDGNVVHVVARAQPAGAPPASQYSISMTVPGGATGLVSGGLETGDQVTQPSPTTITALWSMQAAGDQDSLSFEAGEAAWAAVTSAPQQLPSLAPGASHSLTYDVHYTNAVPDRHFGRLELAVDDGTGGEQGRSSFTVEVASPELAWVKQVVTVGGSAVDVQPVVSNRGSGDAGGAVVALALTAGSATVVDSVAVLGGVAAGKESTLGPALSLDTTDASSLMATMSVRTHYPDGTMRVQQLEDVDFVAPCAPSLTVAEPYGGGAVRLQWEPPTGGCAPGLAGYHIYRRAAGEPSAVRLAGTQPDSTRIYTDLGLAAQSDVFYSVAAVDSSGNEGPRSNEIGTRTWLAELAGWPKQLDAGTPSSPMAVDIDGDGAHEVFAAGNALYGWYGDGTPLVPGSGGEVFRMPRSPQQMNQGANGALWATPAAGDLDGDGVFELVIAAWDDSLWVVRADGAFLWSKSVVAKFSSPALGDLDGDGDLEVVIGSDRPKVFAWHHDGTPVVAANPDGKLADLPDGAYINYSTPALADVDGDPTTVEVLFASFRGNLYAWDYSGALLWTGVSGSTRPLSTPAIGDIDGDGVLEAVVAQGNLSSGPSANRLLVFDATSGSIERIWEGTTHLPGKLYANGNIIHAPSLGDIDADGDLEIVVGTEGGVGPVTDNGATVLVFDHDGASHTQLCQDVVPQPGLNMTNSSGQQVNSQPLIANMDADPAYEVAAGATNFGLFLFDLGAACTPEMGWPLLAGGEIDATPALADLDGDGLAELLVRGRDGWLHAFATREPYVASSIEWGMFGHDPRHTSLYTPPDLTGVAGPAPVGRFRLVGAGPSPFRQTATLDFELDRAGAARLRVYSVSGRLVRTLVNAELPAGIGQVVWDGRGRDGQPVPSGLYFVRLEMGARSATRKLVRLH